MLASIREILKTFKQGEEEFFRQTKEQMELLKIKLCVKLCFGFTSFEHIYVDLIFWNKNWKLESFFKNFSGIFIFL